MKDINKMIYVIFGTCLSIIVLSTILILNKPYTVHFATNSDYEIKSIRVRKNAKIGYLESPTREGYDFLYWTVNGEKVDENYQVRSNNIVFVAEYSAQVPKPKYIITFDSSNGSEATTIEVEENDKVIEPEPPLKDGYIFKEWQLDGETYDFNLEVTKDITLVAIYEKVTGPTYTVKFDTNGGSKISSRIVEEGHIISKQRNPKKKGYIFKEWQLNGKTFSFSTKITEDITLKAVYTADNRKDLTITFNTDGGTKISNQIIKEGDKVAKPSNPTKLGYVFKEWQLNGKAYDFNTKVSKSFELKAIYEKTTGNIYTVTFNTDGGSIIGSKAVEEGNFVKEPEPPTKKGYIFKEWQLNGKKFDFNTRINQNIELKAVYEKEVEKIPVQSVTLDKTSYNLKIGDEVTIVATIKPSNATNKTITWGSSDSSIVSVNNGKIKALKSGTAIITATIDGKSANATVVVAKPAPTYDYELVDVPGSTTGQVYIYITSSEGEHVSGTLTVVYPNDAKENLVIPTTGYLWPSKSTIKAITNVKRS